VEIITTDLMFVNEEITNFFSYSLFRFEHVTNLGKKKKVKKYSRIGYQNLGPPYSSNSTHIKISYASYFLHMARMGKGTF